MEYVGRKIQRAKWELLDFMNESDIQADALGACLRTKSNTLSFWRCHNNDQDIEEIVLAMASSYEKLAKMNVILFRIEDITSNGFEFNETEGFTPIEDLKSRHLDLVHLTGQRILNFASFMKDHVRSNSNCILFSKNQVENILCNALKDNRIDLEDLNEKIRPALKQLISD